MSSPKPFFLIRILTEPSWTACRQLMTLCGCRKNEFMIHSSMICFEWVGERQSFPAGALIPWKHTPNYCDQIFGDFGSNPAQEKMVISRHTVSIPPREYELHKERFSLFPVAFLCGEIRGKSRRRIIIYSDSDLS